MDLVLYPEITYITPCFINVKVRSKSLLDQNVPLFITPRKDSVYSITTMLPADSVIWWDGKFHDSRRGFEYTYTDIRNGAMGYYACVDYRRKCKKFTIAQIIEYMSEMPFYRTASFVMSSTSKKHLFSATVAIAHKLAMSDGDEEDVVTHYSKKVFEVCTMSPYYAIDAAVISAVISETPDQGAVFRIIDRMNEFHGLLFPQITVRFYSVTMMYGPYIERREQEERAIYREQCAADTFAMIVLMCDNFIAYRDELITQHK